MPKVLYVYVIARRGAISPTGLEGVDGSPGQQVVESGELAALVSSVDSEEFSQETIDARSRDLDWLGEIGYRHQQVVQRACRDTDAIPLRAFILFSSEDSLASYLREQAETLTAVLERIAGREEWTVRLEFDEEVWRNAVERRSPSFAAVAAEAEGAPAGKAYLLRRKMDELRKNAAREAVDAVASEIERRLERELESPIVSETSGARTGGLPQINVLLDRSRSGEIEAVVSSLDSDYRGEGVRPLLTGPWPPYTFVTGARDE